MGAIKIEVWRAVGTSDGPPDLNQDSKDDLIPRARLIDPKLAAKKALDVIVMSKEVGIVEDGMIRRVKDAGEVEKSKHTLVWTDALPADDKPVAVFLFKYRTRSKDTGAFEELR